MLSVRHALVLGVLAPAAACGVPDPSLREGAGSLPDARSGDVDADADASTRCLVDDFDGAELGANWDPAAVGAAPTEYSVEAGKLVVRDSPTASTPSDSTSPPEPPRSWIVKLDYDRGNQMARDVDVGDGDFVLEGTLGWTSDIDTAEHPQSWLGGVALTDSEGLIKVMVVAYDPRDHPGMEDGLAGYAAYIQPDSGSTRIHDSKMAMATASTDFGVTRTDGVTSVEVDGAVVPFLVDGELVDAFSMSAALTRLAIVTLRSSPPLEFGELAVDRVSVCKP